MAETVGFVAAFCAVPPPAEASAIPAHHIGSACLKIAKESKRAAQLLGSNASVQAKVDEWLLTSVVELQPLVDDKLLKLNEYLATRTFIVGNSLTLADLVVFGLTHAATTSFPAAQLLHFSHLLRWADLIQSIAGEALVAKCFAAGPVKVSKPQFVPPPPPAPAAAAPAKAAPNGKADAAAKPAAVAAPAKESGDGKKAAAGKPEAAAPAAGGKGESKPAGKEEKGGKEKKEDKKDSAGGKKEGAAAGGKKEGGAAAGGDDDVRIDMLDIRVGTIVKVDKHPNADALYLEEIDVGEEKPRQVISGLVKFVPVEEMQGRRVLCVCNLKPAKMRDVMSYGMVLCASNDEHDKVVPVIPPEGVPNGERVTVAGYDQAPLEEVNPKKKILERLFPDMKTNAEGVPCFKGVPFSTSKGQVASPLANAWVK